MSTTITDLLALFGGGAAVIVAIAGFSYWLFKLFSEKWLSAKFHERLEDYKHQQQKELEELRFKINALMDRTTKLHQREFDVLPEVWAKLVLAHGGVRSVTGSFQSYPDLDRMTEAHLTEFLDKCPLDNWEKERIKREPKKSDIYIKAINFHKAFEARKMLADFYRYLRANGIFVRNEIKVEFDAMAALMNATLVEQEVYLQHETRGPDSRKEREQFAKESDGMLKKLEGKVQARLWDSQALDA
jgi:hypothetical protein